MRELVVGLLLPLGLLPPGLVAASGAGQPDVAVELTFQDPEIVESSGLVALDEGVVTTNDSGDSGRVFTVDADGRTVGTTSWSPDPSDVEALAPAGAGSVWVGDIGDNTGSRDAVTVRSVPVGPGTLEADGPSYELVYPDGARDAESLLAHPATGRLYIATKEVFGGVLYAAPERLDPEAPNRLIAVGPVVPLATDAAFFADGAHLVVRGYASAAVYAFPSLQPVGELDLPDQEQGEGIAVTGDDELLISTEGVATEVLRVGLPDDVRAAMTPPSAQPSSQASRPPTESREGRELPETTETVRSPWPWFLGGFVGLGIIVVLMRSLKVTGRR